MEIEKKTAVHKNGATTELVKDMPLQWPENLTVINLSKRQITDIDENIAFPPKLMNLNLSHNNFKNIPTAVLNLAHIKCLDISYNSIQYFDDTPEFCHSIEDLNLSHNKLAGPPYWVWTSSPSNLVRIDLSCNMNLTHSLTNEYVQELLQYKTLVNEVLIYNCMIRNCLELLSTFSNAKSLKIGSPNPSYLWSNCLSRIPCEGLDQCCDVVKLNISNTQIYSIESNIDIYKNIVEIDLSHNNISSLPNKFCCLQSLELCVLSFNNILYLPEDMVELKNLICLKLDSNELCMLPDGLCSLPNLKLLDLYNNSLYEVADEVENIQKLDLAQNYLEEPDDEEYLEKKARLRLNIENRFDGRKQEASLSEVEYSPDTTDDETLIQSMNNCSLQEPQTGDNDYERSSSPEDWDSDDYWVPRYYQRDKSGQSFWLHFVKRKMEEGSFCPMDLHPVPIADKVKYERMCNPKTWTVVEGQFDDLSSDES